MKRLIAIAMLMALLVAGTAHADKIGILWNGSYLLDPYSTITGLIGAGNSTQIDRIATTVKARSTSPMNGTAGATTPSTGAFTTLSAGAGGFTVDADGDVVAKSVGITRTTAGQCVQLYEGTGGGNESITICAPDAVTTTQTLKLPAAANTAGQILTSAAPAAGVTVFSWTTFKDRITATFDGGGSPIAVNSAAFTRVPFAVTSIDTWTVMCDVDSGTTGIIITPYKDTYAEDTLPTTTMCTTGTIPHTSDGATAGGTVHSAAWDCNITTGAAGDIYKFTVTTAPTSATKCTIILDVTR